MLVVLCLGLAGCTNNPLSPFDDDGAVRHTTRAVGLSPRQVQPAGFVEKSRPETLQYVPVGVTPPARVPLSNPQSVTADLAAKAAASRAAASAPKPTSPYDGKIEPGYKPPPQAPIPPGGPQLKLPAAAAAGGAETPAKRSLRRQRAAEQSGATN